MSDSQALSYSTGYANTLCPMRSATDRLDQRRYVFSSDRAYVIGTTDGRFPPLGRQIRGLMGGVWTPPIKLFNGYWFAIDDEWLPAAVQFDSGPGFVEMHLPPINDLEISRIEFAPNGFPAVLVGLRLHNTQSITRSIRITLDVQSELLASYPWDSSKPSAKECNNKDSSRSGSHPGTLLFTEPGKPWAAVVGAAQPAFAQAIGDEFWGNASDTDRAGFAERGNGTGGQLRWSMQLAGNARQTFWVALAGSPSNAAEAQALVAFAVEHAELLLAEKIRDRLGVLAQNQISLPEPALVAAYEWGKLNMADLCHTTTSVNVRDVNQGKANPKPITTLPSLSGVSDGYPDYANFYGTSSGFVLYPLLAAGMWEPAIQHLRTLRDVSRMINGETGKVVHEVITDGAVYYGNRDAPGNSNETAQFTTAVDMLWSWSGDERFRDEMYDFMVDGMHYIVDQLDHDGDLWPEGKGIAERPGVATEALDVACDTWEALRSLARMATNKGDSKTAAWADAKATAMERAFDKDWWMEDESLYADSRCNADDIGKPEAREQGWTNTCTVPDQKLQQRIWVSVIPMKTLLAPPERAHRILDQLETPDFTDASGNLYLVGEHGGPDGQAIRQSWTLATGVLAIAEANYGRLAEHQALRSMRALAACLDLEMPGALPEVVPSPDYDPFGDFCERFMVMQAWASYGIGWPVMHNLLGIRPNLPEQTLSVIPQIPPSWPSLSGRNIRVGQGAITVTAARDSQRYTTTTITPPGWKLNLGHVLPAKSDIVSVMLDDQLVDYDLVESLRGCEVRVETTSDAAHTLVITIK